MIVSLSPYVQPTTTILNVEDDDRAFRVITIAFDELGLPVILYRAVDADDALRFLHKQGAYIDAPRPELILMNINLPKRTGIELLAAVKSNPELASIPVVMFTSSSMDTEVTKCLALGARAFMTKPDSYSGVLAAMKSVFTIATASGGLSEQVANAVKM